MTGKKLAAVFLLAWSLLASSSATAGIECPIDCPVTDLGANNDAGDCGAIFNFTIPSEEDCDVTCTPPSGSFFDVGTTLVVCTTDDDECQFNVVIKDTERPTVGPIEPLDPCYPSVEAAIDAATTAVSDVGSDNCAVDHVRTVTSAINNQCQWSAQFAAVDEAGNESTPPVSLGAIIDGEDPVTGPFVVEDCYDTVAAAEADLEAKILAASTDNCPGELTVHLNCELVGCTLSCHWGVSDGCGNGFVQLDPIVVSIDNVPPTLDCPDDITVERGDKICSTEVQDWLDSATADDDCPGVVVTNDSTVNGFECGFPAGTTTTVTFTATDACGNTASCTADITVAPLHRINATQKGSLLVFSKVEVKWDAAGNLTQDTFLDFANDSDTGAVDVQAFLINGDRTLEEITTDDGTVIQDAEPGWNRIDCRFELTKNQPHYWSAAWGSDKCGSFTALDGDGPGRPDPEVPGGRVLRGYAVMWAVKFHDPRFNDDLNGLGYYDEIRWNHLKGDALIINYAEGSAWEYNAWAAQARCGANGAPVPDCLITDANGVCCDAAPIPGNIGLDGFAYDVTYDRLLLDFYATGTTALSAIRADGSAGVGISLDTDLTLHSMDIDLRQDGEGPILSKAEFEVFNQNEVKLSGLRRCICCWDQTMFSDYVQHVGIPNYFLLGRLGTDKGQARIDAVRSVVEECNYCETCGVEPRIRRTPITASTGGTAGIGEIIDVCQLNFSQDTALLGLSTKFVNFENGSMKIDRAGMNLVGTGEQTRLIEIANPSVAGTPTPTIAFWQYGSRIQYDVPRGADEARNPVSISAPRQTRSGKQTNPVETLRGDRTKE